MQMVSAIKMRKAQAVAVESRPYRETLVEMLQKVSQRINIDQSPLLHPAKNAQKKKLIIFVSSNKGLAGTFHTNLARFFFKHISVKEAEFITLGKKAASFIVSMGGEVSASFTSNNLLVDITPVFELALRKFLAGEVSEVSVAYNNFISTSRSATVQEVLLPFKIAVGEGSPFPSQREQFKSPEYVIEPSPEEIINPLLQSLVEEQIRGAVINSEAVEHSSRMIAMKNATDNATDVIYNLTLLGNKLRQGRITSELLDMITAKESVEN